MMVLIVGAWVLVAGCVTQQEIDRDFRARRQGSYQVLSRVGGESSVELEVIAGPLSVGRSLEVALSHNKDVQTAKVQFMQARGEVTEATSTAMPKLTFTGWGHVNDNSGFSQQKETYQLQLLLKQPLYLGGLAGAALDAAAVFEYMTGQQLSQTVQMVYLRVQQLYLAALLAGELVEVSEQALRDAQEHYSDVSKKLKYGVGTRFDVLRAEVRVNAVKAELIQRSNERRLALVGLLNELGVSQLSEVELVDRLEYDRSGGDESVETNLRRAIEGRPELLIGEAMIRLAQDNVKAEQAGDRPKVSLEGLYQRDYPGFSADLSGFGGGASGGEQWERTMYAGIVLEWPVFDGLKTAGRVTKAKAEVRRQEVALKKLEQQIQLEVTEALLNVQSSREFVESQLGNVDSAEEALRLAQVYFREGNGTSLDVITAESGLTQARWDYSTAVHNYQAALLELHWAVGALGAAEAASGNESEMAVGSEADQWVIAEGELLPGTAAEDPNEGTGQ